MGSNEVKEMLGEAVCDAVKEVREEGRRRTDDKVSQIQEMDITRAAAALLDANVEEGTIEMLLCKYWDLRPSEARWYIREGEEERKI